LSVSNPRAEIEAPLATAPGARWRLPTLRSFPMTQRV
jgi:hypothetical protein